MPYQETVQSRITLATTAVTQANLGATLFATTHQYFVERIRGYSSWEEVTGDPAIPSTSPAYEGLRRFFSQPNAAVPVYLGRREADSIELTPSTTVNTSEYGFIITVRDDLTNTPVETIVSITSDSDATAEEIATALVAEVTASVVNVTPTDNTGSLSIVADAGYSFTITHIEKLLDTYTTSETAAELFAAIVEEDNENWYFFTSDDQSETFVLAMADEIEATESSNYPKQYHVMTAEAGSVTPIVDPFTDTLGKLKEGNYNRTAGYWYHDATYHQELVSVAQMGSRQPGGSTWKFVQDTAARDLVTGKKLSTQKQGYILDRNATVYGEERGVEFSHGGKMASGEFIDIIRAKDWLNDQIESRLLNLLLNQGDGKISFRDKDKLLIANTVDTVLSEAVNLNILTGYEPTTVPDIVPFADQANRLLDNVRWTGYLAGAVHFIIVNGILTYAEQELE